MRIDVDEARRIAILARLEYSPAQLQKMADDMTQILGYIDQLKGVDGGEEQAGGDPLPLRSDEPHPTLDPELAGGNAPEWEGGFFVVPRVIGD